MATINNIFEVAAIDVTYDCNLRCRHCFNYSGEHESGGLRRSIMSSEELFRVIKDVAVLNPITVCLCGGEPLLRKNDVFGITRYLKKAGVKNVNTVSNGLIIDNKLASEIKSSGIDMVQVSLDGATEQSHNWLRNNPRSFNAAINAIECLVNAGLYVGVAFTPTQKNIDEIDTAIALFESLGVSAFRVQPIMKLGRAASIEEYFLDSISYIKLSRKISMLRENKTRKKPIVIEWGDPLEHLVAFANNYRNKSLIINAYGDLLISPYVPISFGDLKKHSILEYISRGFSEIHANDAIKRVIKLMRTENDMNLSTIVQSFPELYRDEFFDFDLINSDIKQCSNLLNEILDRSI
jgi:MoaA/NifB/PqqE/SkfB family radical SAM enzyme